MNAPTENFEGNGENDGDQPEDPRLAALVEALAKGETVDWQKAESSAGGEEERDQIRALAAISEVASFHRTWLAEGGILGDLDEEEEPDDEVPTHWGELEILDRVGRGSFGDVYKAREPRLDRIVALKLIRASARTPEREAETLREGRLLAKVRHPNVATVYGTAGADGRVGFWMEFLEGKNLAEILGEQGNFAAREAAEIGIALCRALAAVHAQGIVHRDVKAQNVVRENDGRIVLTDFGVGRDTALLQSEEPSLSGTPLYLAPELFEGKPPSPASDLYALGVLLFYLVTGEFPITGDSFDELRAAHQGRKRRWLKELRKDLPGTFVAAVERALDRDPEKRGDEAGLEKELGRFLGERGNAQRLRRVLLVVGVVVLCTVVSAWGYLELRDRHRTQALSDESELFDKDPDAAIRLLEEAVRNDPKFVGGWQQLGLRLQSQGDYPNSEKAISMALKLCEGSESIECVLADAYIKLSRMEYREALKLFDKASTLDPENATTWRQIAMLHVNLLEPAKGMNAAREAAKLEPAMAMSVGVVPLIMAEASDPAAAAVASEARRSLPGKAYLFWPEGIAELVSGNRDKAFTAFGQLGRSPNFAKFGQIFQAQILLEQGNFNRAEVLLSTGLSADLGNSTRELAQRHILLALIAIHRENFPAAWQHLETLIGEKGSLIVMPDHLKFFRSAAVIAVRSGNIDLAKRFLGIVTFLKVKFDSPLSRAFEAHVKGEIAAEKGDLAEAQQRIEEGIQDRGDTFLLASKVRVLVRLGDCPLASQFAAEIDGQPGLIYADYTVPWIEIREAIDLAKSCTPK